MVVRLEMTQDLGTCIGGELVVLAEEPDEYTTRLRKSRVKCQGTIWGGKKRSNMNPWILLNPWTLDRVLWVLNPALLRGLEGVARVNSWVGASLYPIFPPCSGPLGVRASSRRKNGRQLETCCR